MVNNMNLKPWKSDVAVLLIFFIRDDVFALTFEAVRRARPRVLLLWQDGAREDHPNDIAGIEKCRRIAENVDWDCEVHKNYQSRNWGCDPSTFYSHKWAFSIVDKCIILEDDCVPSQSFFAFCKELLDRYEYDTRINKICGMCNIENFESRYSYIFSSVGSGPGFATWKRVADTWEEDYPVLDDSYELDRYKLLKHEYNDKKYLKTCFSHKGEGVPHWETIQTLGRHLNSQLVIISTISQIHNIGLGANSTHSNSQIDLILPRLRQITYQNSHEIEFPLIHPKYVVEDKTYKSLLFKITGRDGNFSRKKVYIEQLMYKMFKGGLSQLMSKFVSKYFR